MVQAAAHQRGLNLIECAIKVDMGVPLRRGGAIAYHQHEGLVLVAIAIDLYPGPILNMNRVINREIERKRDNHTSNPISAVCHHYLKAFVENGKRCCLNEWTGQRMKQVINRFQRPTNHRPMLARF